MHCDSEDGDNQRLEFLGDAVLGLVIADALYQKLEGCNEGELDRARASIVNGSSISAMALELGIGPHIQVSESQRKHHPEPSASMLEDTLEALIGAIFLDGGMDAARDFILRIFKEQLAAIEPDSTQGNPKGLLQEWAQKEYSGLTPIYELVRAEGPDHQRRYIVSVQLNDKELGQGEGSSIKQAEMDAAEAALRTLPKDD